MTGAGAQAFALALPGGLSARRFLSDHWQRHPLLLPAAMSEFRPPLTPDEIAGLACEPDVESRLIRTVRDDGGTRYAQESGPFTERRLRGLGDSDWTLLVHDVEKHLPDLRPLLHAPRFLPAWRLGDLMVSVAAPGGSVGAHRDSYDVFLLQGDGEREWRLGSGEAVEEDAGLRLLRGFRTESTHRCRRGDVLYVPPGAGHHGVARSLCTTWSIGMQAPLLADLAAMLGLPPAATAGDTRYTDPDLDVDECAGALIAPATLARIRRQLPATDDVGDAALADAFGRLVTLPKPPLRPLPVAGGEAAAVLGACRRGEPARWHGMCAVACWRAGDDRLLFAAGHALPVDEEIWPLARELANLDSPAGLRVDGWLRRPAAESLLADLIRLGLLEIAAG